MRHYYAGLAGLNAASVAYGLIHGQPLILVFISATLAAGLWSYARRP